MSTRINLSLDAKDVLDSVGSSEETDFLLEALERFGTQNVNAALREYFGSLKDRLAGMLDNVGYLEEESFLLEALERFDRDNVNAALREYSGMIARMVFFEKVSVLLDLLERFDSNSVYAATRNYFCRLCEDGEELPDFVDAEKL